MHSKKKKTNIIKNNKHPHKILSVFSNHSGKVEQFITKYKKVENLRECLKRRTKNRLIRKGFKAENRLPIDIIHESDDECDFNDLHVVENTNPASSLED